MTIEELGMCFSYNLNRMIRRRGLTQRVFAERVGLTRRTVGRYVYGGRLPRIDILVMFADELDCSFDELLHHDSETLKRAEELKSLRVAKKYIM